MGCLFRKLATFLVFFSFILSPLRAICEEQPKKGAPSDTQSKAISLFTFNQILRQVDNYYVDEVNVEKLLFVAVQAMFKELDMHSAYLDHSQLENIFGLANGQYSGLGIEVEQREEGIFITETLKRSPAEAAGLLTGDKIIKIDEHDITGKNVDEVAYIARGQSGEKVLITVQRKNIPSPMEYMITRAVIDIESIEAKLLPNDIAYTKIHSFQKQTAQELKVAIQALMKQNPKLVGLILDLRDNPGGILDSAVEVTDLFLNEGTIVSTRGRFFHANNEYVATTGDMMNGRPIVVLINEGSASAAEIVAGALQSHRRATIAGSNSYGKGSVQSLIPLSEGNTAIKLTTAIYYTPDGVSIDGEGISPDITLAKEDIPSLQYADLLQTASENPNIQRQDTMLLYAERLLIQPVNDKRQD
ncbi:S41 family peptidase [Algicola sagamiensis]|uniref:S41 family peptidase n=1 Tax=Algicola sagamiensis TaxID=163869 RepID=UPI00037FB3BA|nr:S41 family peptidase [Algicola sagamiensis]